jgi:hypothetical protein
MGNDSDTPLVNIYFSDFFDVPPAVLEEYGALNISLVNDLPLFIDPFLLFHSKNPVYRDLHEGIIRYLRFLRDKSTEYPFDRGLLESWYFFKEVKQNWLGFSRIGNQGSALGKDFADSLRAGLASIFRNFGDETVTSGSHLEKVCLVTPGVGRDNISDFTTNLIKHFLLDYTQAFAQSYLHEKDRGTFTVPKVRFNYDTESWEHETYELPSHLGDFVLLTPRNLLTRDEIWINRNDLINHFEQIAEALPDQVLRGQLNNYLWNQLAFDSDMSAKDRARKRRQVIDQALVEYPQVVEYFIRDKEDTGDHASEISSERVTEVEQLLIDQVAKFVDDILSQSEFYEIEGNSLGGALRRIQVLRRLVEQQGGWRYLYIHGEPIKREVDIQLFYLLSWRAHLWRNVPQSPNIRSEDSVKLHFKLAANPFIKRTMESLFRGREGSTADPHVVVVVCAYTGQEQEKIRTILQDLGLVGEQRVQVIDLHGSESDAGADFDRVPIDESEVDQRLEPKDGKAREGSLQPHGSGSRLVEDLRRALDKNELLVVVGTGVSIRSSGDAPASSWKGLLREGVDWCMGVGRADERWVRRQLAAIEEGDLNEIIGVAELITSRLDGSSGAEFGLWLRETVGKLTCTQPDVLNAIGALQTQVATTNYDGLIEGVTGLRPITWNDDARIFRLLRGDENGVLHLHGYWEEPDTVVLGVRSYESIVRDEQKQNVLRTLPLMRSLMFVGFGEGLSDPNFGPLFRWIRDNLSRSEYRHFRLARESEVEEIQKLHPNEERVSVISFGESYDDLAPFLKGLRR